MKTKVLVFLLFVLVGDLFSQPWQVLDPGTTSNIFDVTFINSSTGFIPCTDGTIKKTTDAGISWNTVLSQTTLVTSLYFFNEDIGFAVGQFGRVYKTTNSGIYWSLSTPTSYTLRGVYFTDNLTGYIVGDHGCIMKTTNQGTTWDNQISPISNANFTGVYFTNTKGYISVSDQASNLLYTTDAGNNWQDGKIRPGIVLALGLSFNENFGFLGGYEEMEFDFHPLIFKTTNNGSSWSEYRLTSKGIIYDVAVSPVNSNKICAVGRYYDDPVYHNQGLLMRSSDGGESWTEEQFGGENTEFRAVHATTNDFFVVGKTGLILKTSQIVGISNVNSEIPFGYSLSQNYPNPFNPTTQINFTIPKSGNVRLVVYNTAGIEVSVLLSQNLSAGDHTVHFDAINLTSGVYFYTLESESFTDTKRMVLLK